MSCGVFTSRIAVQLQDLQVSLWDITCLLCFNLAFLPQYSQWSPHSDLDNLEQLWSGRSDGAEVRRAV